MKTVEVSELEKNKDMKETYTNSDIQQKFAFVEQLKKQGTCIITLGDLFEAIEGAPEISEQVDRIFEKRGPIKILIEGSAFEQNMDVVDQKLSKRSNPDDSILLIDIREVAARQHLAHVQHSFPEKNYVVVQ